jgi:hypothetical protein
MTIDAGNSLNVIESIIRLKDEPQESVPTEAKGRSHGHEQRLFFCPDTRILGAENQGRICFLVGKNIKIRRNYLAHLAEIHYINMLYNVVWSRFMQGIAVLRKVAEVVIISFAYLTLLHIANSKGTVVAK